MVLMDINFTYPLPTIEVPDSLQISDNCVVEPEDPPAAKRPKKTRVRCMERDSETVCEDPFRHLNESIADFPKPFEDSNCETASSITVSTDIHQDEQYQNEFPDEDALIQPFFIEDVVFPEDDSKNSESFIPEFDKDTEKLFSGAKLSSLEAITMLVSWFSMFPSMSKEAFSRLLYLLHTFILPEENMLPSSYYHAMKKIKPFLSPIKEYHVCPNDCIIYRDCDDGKFEKLTECPICGESRFSQNGMQPKKVFKYLSIAKRVKRLFSDATTSQLLQGHIHSSADSSPIVTSIHQSKAWLDCYKRSGSFRGDNRVISFAFCTDGLNPFAQHKNNYSMMPMFLIPLNLPHHIRSKSGAMMLTGIVPGPKEPGTLQPYLDLVVDDLAQLNKITLYDAHRNEQFKLQVNILLTVCDYPGQNKVFDTQGAGAYSGCTYCCVKGEYSRTLDKMVYLDHRCFLPHTDVLRKDSNNFPSKRESISQAPQLKTMEFVDKAIQDVCSAKNKREKKNMLQEVGCRGPYSFRKLPFYDRFLSTPVEPMHLIKNISEHIVKLLSGSKDSLKVREEEKQRERFSMSWVTSENILPPAPFTLSKSEREIANSRAISILVPAGFDWKPRRLFVQSGIGYIKSIEWKHILTCGILKYCLRDLLGGKQRRTLFELCDVISLLTKDAISSTELDVIEYRVHRVLALIERDFPVSLNVISFHLLHHLPMYIRRFGPVYEFHMFPMERFNSWIGKRVMNKRFPEATVLESYRLFEFSFFLQISGRIPNSRCFDVLDGNDSEADTSEVSSSGKLESDEMNALESLYQKIDPDYGTLVSMYELEKKRAKKAHRVKKFPPLSRWESGCDYVLSQDQLELRHGPSNSVTDLRTYTLKDDHGRCIKYAIINSTKKSVSSCVSLCLDSVLSQGEMKFGQIARIFQHVFNKKMYTLAKLQWFCDIELDRQSGLYFSSNTTVSPYQIVPLKDLSKPLVHALDGQKFWFLNV